MPGVLVQDRIGDGDRDLLIMKNSEKNSKVKVTKMYTPLQ